MPRNDNPWIRKIKQCAVEYQREKAARNAPAPAPARARARAPPVSYTHLTLPTKRIV